MAFKRRGSSAMRRKIYTGGGLAIFPSVSSATMDAGFAGWVKPPAGSEDTLIDVGKWEQSNDTLVRTNVRQAGTVINAQGGFLGIWHIGVIAWDGNSDTDLANPPDILNPNLEWIIRNEQIFANGDSTFDMFSFGFPADSILESKAQRKLPEGTGLIVVSKLERFSGGYDAFNAAAEFRFWFKQA